MPVEKWAVDELEATSDKGEQKNFLGDYVIDEGSAGTTGGVLK